VGGSGVVLQGGTEAVRVYILQEAVRAKLMEEQEQSMVVRVQALWVQGVRVCMLVVEVVVAILEEEEVCKE